MFVEHKEQGEAVPVKVGTLKLSEAIRIGIGILPAREQEQSRWCWKFCALGAAFAGVHGRQMTADEFSKITQSDMGTHAGKLADMIGFPRAICLDVSNMHFEGKSAESCAYWLESRGL